MPDISTPPAVPSITGNPVVDTAFKAVILPVAASLSTVLIGYLTSHGITNANLDAQIPVLVTAVLTSLVTIGVGVWMVISKRTTVNAVITQSIEAAQTGVVPDAVKVLATLDQKTAINLAATK